MKTATFLSLLGLSAILLLSPGFSTTSSTPLVKKAISPTDQPLIKRGQYLVAIMGCHDCHSPKTMGPQGPQLVSERLLSGYPAERPLPSLASAALKDWVLFNSDNTAAAGPWGVSFAANLTSDATGIGTWSLAQFKRALTQGKAKGIATNRMLLPPMPWTNYQSISDEDLSAIFAYLQSTKPVANVVPAPLPPAK